MLFKYSNRREAEVKNSSCLVFDAQPVSKRDEPSQPDSNVVKHL